VEAASSFTRPQDAGLVLGYQPALDGLRCAAIVPVITAHYYHHPSSGFLGVDLFFVLSGFLITTLLVEEWIRRGTISLSRFYLRRALRLGPALAVLLLTFTALVVCRALFGYAAAPASAGESLRAILFGATYTTNFAVILTHTPLDLQPLWSLAVEEQYYIVWPLILLTVIAAGGLRWLIPGLMVAVLAVVVIRWQLAPANPGVFDAAAVTRFDSILIGCLAALVRFRRIRVPSWSYPLALVGLALIMLSNDSRIFYDGLSDLFCLLAAVIVLSVVENRSILQRALSLAPLVFVGRISYALYLWHFAILNWVERSGAFSSTGHYTQITLALIISFLVAVVSYRFVERPFLRIKWRISRVASHDAPMAVALARAHDEVVAS